MKRFAHVWLDPSEILAFYPLSEGKSEYPVDDRWGIAFKNGRELIVNAGPVVSELMKYLSKEEDQ